MTTGRVDDRLQDEDGLLTVAEAAQAVHVSKGTVRKWIHRGQVVTVLWCGRRMVGEQSLFDAELATRSAGRPRGERSQV